MNDPCSSKAIHPRVPRSICAPWIVPLLLLAASSLSGATLYVSLENTNPIPPYTNWATAATNIQAAVDAAQAQDTVLVTNGLYAAGGRAVYGTMTNRVAVDKALTLQSINGPDVTIIQGYQVPGHTNWNGAIRCAYLANGAVLSGFTLNQGATSPGDATREASGGGVWCESVSAVVTNCVLTGNSAGVYGGGAYNGTLNNCTLTGNWADASGGGGGGGAYNGTLNNCTLTGNSAKAGGGAYYGSLNNCTVSGNWASSSGGGVSICTLNNCLVSGNWAKAQTIGETAYSGGAHYGTLNNCTLTGNRADMGGGTYRGALINCTVTGNSASYMGGGVHNAPLTNCIVYYNNAGQDGPNCYACDNLVSYSCTTPLPPGGTNNIALDPQLASVSHLSAGSPCRGAGSAAYSIGTDIDGEAWGNPPSIGCDEYRTGAVTGPLTVGLPANYTNVAVGYSLGLTALIAGRTSGSVWDFGDGTVVSNRPYMAHAWATAGDYAVVLRVYNESYPDGVTASMTAHVTSHPVYYVAAGNIVPVPPYTNWATAATNIQNAVDAASVAGALVLVTNGVYPGSLGVNKPLALRSVNGPQFTTINGGGPCVTLTDGASLSGFTLANRHSSVGGGVWCESGNAFLTNCTLTGNSADLAGGGAAYCTLNNCTLTGNSALLGSASGGGAWNCTLNNCTVSSNWARFSGGGVSVCTLNNCTVSGNWAEAQNGNGNSVGGGAFNSTLNNCTVSGNWAAANPFPPGAYRAYAGGVNGGTLNNCIVYYNTATVGANYYNNSTFAYSCTTPLPSGLGNIANAPLFVDYAGGNLRLQSNSPCVNSGNNSYVSSSTDLDGRPRIVGGTVDIGAYEFLGAGIGEFIGWLQRYGLATDGTADYVDCDGDGMNNWQEWICGTCPTNALSALRLLSPTPHDTYVTVSWQSVAGIHYFLERSADLMSPFMFVATNILGQAVATSYGDTNGAGAGPFFYRVGIRAP